MTVPKEYKDIVDANIGELSGVLMSQTKVQPSTSLVDYFRVSF